MESKLYEEIFLWLFGDKSTPEEVFKNEGNLKIYRDWCSITKTAVNKAKKEALAEGRAVGLAEGRAYAEGITEGKTQEATRIAKIMKDKGLDAKHISEITGIPVSEIEGLT